MSLTFYLQVTVKRFGKEMFNDIEQTFRLSWSYNVD